MAPTAEQPQGFPSHPWREPGSININPSRKMQTMPLSHDAAPSRKTSRPRNFKAPHPGWSRIEPPVDSSGASRSIYDGRDRLGSYRCCMSRWIAVDRLNRPIGSFDSEHEARLAIYAAGGRP
jgi:hypothetical protein